MTRLLTALAIMLVAITACNPPKRDDSKKEDKKAEDRPKEEPKFVPVTTIVRPDLASEKVDFVIDATELNKEWKDDSKAAKEKYEGEILEVTGYVDQVTSLSVIVCASPMPYSNTYVAHCMAPQEKLNRLHRLGVGQKVKVRAKNRSQGIIVDLISFTELEPSSLIEVTAEELAREFEKDPLAAEKKYKNKDVVVTGRVKQLKKDELSHQATLVGSDTTSVFVLASDPFARWEGKRNVEVRVSLVSYNADRKHVEAWGFIVDSK